MWIQCNAEGVVTRKGQTKRSPRAGTADYEVDAMPAYQSGDIVKYDGVTFTVDSSDRLAAEKMALENEVIKSYRKWKDAEALQLSCVNMCKAEYEAIKAEYDAL
tara:strand:- start:1 stop:312 length:312 start_codon:yes stop_codon:yes gene_type:complete